MKNLTVNDVAKALNKSPQYIRVCLQKGLLPFGTAAKMHNSSQWCYVIFPKKFEEYVGNEAYKNRSDSASEFTSS